MYRQILITGSSYLSTYGSTDFQRILWQINPETPIKTYRLNTVTYGFVLASYLATGCLEILSETMREQYPEALSSIERDFYMDDFLECIETREKEINLLKQSYYSDE